MENKIILEKFVSLDDFSYFYQLVSNEEVMRANYGRVFTMDESRSFYEIMLRNSNRFQNIGEYKVFDSSNNVYIGFGGINSDENAIVAEIDYMLLPEYWGKGFGSEIVKELLTKAESKQSIKKIIAITDPQNIASKKILFKNGFKTLKVSEIDDGSLAEEFFKEIVG